MYISSLLVLFCCFHYSYGLDDDIPVTSGPSPSVNFTSSSSTVNTTVSSAAYSTSTLDATLLSTSPGPSTQNSTISSLPSSAPVTRPPVTLPNTNSTSLTTAPSSGLNTYATAASATSIAVLSGSLILSPSPSSFAIPSMSNNPSLPVSATESSASDNITITNTPQPIQTLSTTVSGQVSLLLVISGVESASPITLFPTITIGPTGTAASSSRSAIQTQLSSSAFILIQGWLNNVKEDTRPVIQGLDDTERMIKNTLSDISSKSDKATNKGCKHSLFSLLSCAVSTVTNISGKISGIKGTVTDDIINGVKSSFSDLEKLSTELDENKEDDQENSETSDQTSTSSETCTQSSVTEDLYVFCSPSLFKTGTITSTTQICQTGTSTVSGCTVSAFATTTTISRAASESTVSMSQSLDFEGKDTGAEVTSMIPSLSSEMYAALACLTVFTLPFPTGCDIDNITLPSSSSNSATTTNSSGTTVPSSNSISKITSSTSVSISTMSSPRSATSCTLSNASAWSTNGDNFPATILCTCNDGWQAGISTTVGTDLATTYTCQIGSTAPVIAVSTAPPASTLTKQPSSVAPEPAPAEIPSPAAPPKPDESCHTHYAGIFDTFDIYGIEWDEDKLKDGAGLKKNIGGCAKLTNWKYETVDVGTWQFHASGRTTIWQKHCIEDAIASSGAPYDSCNGSG